MKAEVRGRGWWMGVIFIILFWMVLYLYDYPRPHVDDGLYIGAGINLYRGLGFFNTFCDTLQHPPFLGRYNAYLPGQSYLLAMWLHLFGLNSWSMRALPVVCALGSSLALYRFFRPSRWGVISAFGICVAVLVFLGGTGLRSDALGLFFFAIGLGILRSRNEAGYFFGNLSLALGMIVSANLAYVGVLLTVGTLARVVTMEWKSDRWLVVRWTLAAGMAYGLTVGLFFWLIDFNLKDFLPGLLKNQQLGAGIVQSHFSLHGIYDWMKWGGVQIPFLVLVGWLIWFYRRERSQWLYLVLLMASYVAMIFVSRSSVAGVHLWAFGCVLAGFYLLWNGICPGKWRGVLVWFGFLGTFVLFHGHYMLVGLLCDHRMDEVRNQEIRQEVAQFKGKVYLDPYAMRELYGYDMPQNAADYCQSSLSGWLEPQSFDDIGGNSIEVVSVGFAFPEHGGEKARPLLGKNGKRVCENPYDLVVNYHP